MVSMLLLIEVVMSCRLIKGYRALGVVRAGKVTNKPFYAEIPCQVQTGNLLIPVTIGAQSYWYVFDTGAHFSVTDSIRKLNRFKNKMTVQLGSSNKLKTNVSVTQIDQLQTAGVTFKHIGAFVLDFEQAPRIRCLTNGGLFGSSVIRKYVWQIDYDRQKIVATDQLSKLNLPANALRIPVNLDKRGFPFVTLQVNGQPIRFLFDLGFGGLFSLPEATAQAFVKGKIIERTGIGSEGTHGSVQETVKIALLDSIGLSQAVWRNVAVSYSKSSTYPLVGAELAKYYLITLDLSHEVIYLTPRATLQPKQEGFAHFGLSLTYQVGKVMVDALYGPSPAQQAGIEVGDEITRINGQAVHYSGYCDCLLASNALLKSVDRITLTVRKKDVEQTVELTKRRLL